MEKSKLNWLNSIDNNESIEKQHALKIIYDNEVKLEIARINNIDDKNVIVHDIDFDMLSRTKINILLDNELTHINNKIKLYEFIYNCHKTDDFEEYFRANIPKLISKYEGILYAIDEYNNYNYSSDSELESDLDLDSD
jgi:hypothetical protein